MTNKRKVVPNERGDHSCRWSGEARDSGPSFTHEYRRMGPCLSAATTDVQGPPFFSVNYRLAGGTMHFSITLRIFNCGPGGA
jgi:hypothetical protein